ncbi:hypothetical protein AAA799P11_00287 [Marine Group I thaumarchaeote SCGC AAA799-P11]|uniref:Uncharacterized protein n=1 Tax=Marine Group I thaumarchaeote SCGC AAA799-P11 TaxID=1502295 RepID=A0A087S2M9_9ARCH|nr:hypothetical protein AAA799P11_00287 [Marine Group I thaumarchaeote SCGC AAA799-P11]
MRFYIVLPVFFLLIIGTTASLAYAQVDALNDIKFLQTGIIETSENEFSISNDIAVREFFGGNIIRVYGQTIEGFPYITYSKILEGEINTHGIIFVGGEFLRLSFEEKPIQESPIEKEDDLQIIVQYTQRVYSKQYATIEIKTYDPEQNKLKDFNQNYGFLANINIEIIVLNENNEEFYSTNGITNNKGFFETEFYIPERYPQETLTVTINAEDNDSKSSKILQVFTLGAIPDNDSSP